MAFQRLSLLRRKPKTPPNPNQVNTSPRSSNVTMPRGTLRRQYSQEDVEPNFVYELDNHRGTQVELSTEIKPSPCRKKDYPGKPADRPDLDSFWSYLYHGFVDPCCGDLERVLYSITKTDHDGMFEKEDTMKFFGETDSEDSDSEGDDDDDSSLESREPIESPSRKFSFAKVVSFRTSTMAEI